MTSAALFSSLSSRGITRRHAARTDRALVTLVLGLAVASCAKDKEPARAEPTPAPQAAAATAEPVAEPPALDASWASAIGAGAGLTPREDNELATILTRLSAPCPSEAVSVAQCIVEHRACSDCDRAARYLAIGVHAGWPSTYLQMAFRARFDPKEKIDLPVDGSPTTGPADAGVTIVEFGSYLCSHCAAEAPKLDALMRAYPKGVRLVFKPAWSPENAPQVQATRAALAAAAQGKFWKMHAALFANQPNFDTESIDGYAKSIGLDTVKLHAAMASEAVTEQMKKDNAVAMAAHIDDLPSLWINGRPVPPFEDLGARVAFEIANK